jgi:hypothetical protein
VLTRDNLPHYVRREVAERLRDVGEVKAAEATRLRVEAMLAEIEAEAVFQKAEELEAD